VTVLERIFGIPKPLIAMCHLRGLPGRPRHDGQAGMAGIYSALRDDVLALQEAGVDGLLFCNEHDLPYSIGVGVEVAVAQAAVIGRLHGELRVPFGVDLLWDPKSALAVARATGAAFVREVFTGVFDSDMGLLAPDFGELAGYRHAIGGDEIAIFTNVTPEFSRSVSGRPVAERARGAAFLGADALLVSGPQAGVAVNLAELAEAKESAGDVPVLANTGVSDQNAAEILATADGVIVGTHLKIDGSTWNAVDPQRARRLVEIVRAARARG
jgi:membrane complex biogenesis BtpA family protein